MEKVIIVGAGGHGREIADILSASNNGIDVVGFVDDNSALHGSKVEGILVLGDVSLLRDGVAGDIIIGVGDPCTAIKLAERAGGFGRRFARAISAKAVVSPRAKVGEGVVIFPGVVVGPDVTIGDHCILNVGSTVSHDCVLGRHVVVNPGAHLAGNVKCEEGAFIGMGANVIQGRRIGAWARIGAGAAVIEDIPAHTTAVGVPARVVRRR